MNSRMNSIASDCSYENYLMQSSDIDQIRSISKIYRVCDFGLDSSKNNKAQLTKV